MKQLQVGWNTICKYETKKQLTLIKTAFAVEGIFFTVHLLNYCTGIFWSAEQAVEDYKGGINPSIGGHSLEWTAETIAMLNIAYYQIEEIANVGKLQLGIDLLRKKITLLKEETPPYWSVSCNRLMKEMGTFINKIPKGTFFNWPSFLLYDHSDEK